VLGVFGHGNLPLRSRSDGDANRGLPDENRR
jgi:hypothetical protein